MSVKKSKKPSMLNLDERELELLENQRRHQGESFVSMFNFYSHVPNVASDYNIARNYDDYQFQYRQDILAKLEIAPKPIVFGAIKTSFAFNGEAGYDFSFSAKNSLIMSGFSSIGLDYQFVDLSFISSLFSSIYNVVVDKSTSIFNPSDKIYAKSLSEEALIDEDSEKDILHEPLASEEIQDDYPKATNQKDFTNKDSYAQTKAEEEPKEVKNEPVLEKENNTKNTYEDEGSSNTESTEDAPHEDVPQDEDEASNTESTEDAPHEDVPQDEDEASNTESTDFADMEESQPNAAPVNYAVSIYYPPLKSFFSVRLVEFNSRGHLISSLDNIDYNSVSLHIDFSGFNNESQYSNATLWPLFPALDYQVSYISKPILVVNQLPQSRRILGSLDAHLLNVSFTPREIVPLPDFLVRDDHNNTDIRTEENPAQKNSNSSSWWKVLLSIADDLRMFRVYKGGGKEEESRRQDNEVGAQEPVSVDVFSVPQEEINLEEVVVQDVVIVAEDNYPRGYSQDSLERVLILIKKLNDREFRYIFPILHLDKGSDTKSSQLVRYNEASHLGFIKEILSGLMALEDANTEDPDPDKSWVEIIRGAKNDGVDEENIKSSKVISDLCYISSDQNKQKKKEKDFEDLLGKGHTEAKFPKNVKNPSAIVFAKESDIYIGYRGTKDPEDFLTDANIFMSSASKIGFKKGFIHSGFLGYVLKTWPDVLEEICNHCKKHNKKISDMNIHFTGHSLGGAAATIAAAALSNFLIEQNENYDIRKIHLVTFAAPRVFDLEMVNYCRNMGLWDQTIRVISNKDPIPYSVLGSFGYKHIGNVLKNRSSKTGCFSNMEAHYLSDFEDIEYILTYYPDKYNFFCYVFSHAANFLVMHGERDESFDLIKARYSEVFALGATGIVLPENQIQQQIVGDGIKDAELSQKETYQDENNSQRSYLDDEGQGQLYSAYNSEPWRAKNNVEFLESLQGTIPRQEDCSEEEKLDNVESEPQNSLSSSIENVFQSDHAQDSKIECIMVYALVATDTVFPENRMQLQIVETGAKVTESLQGTIASSVPSSIEDVPQNPSYDQLGMLHNLGNSARISSVGVHAVRSMHNPTLDNMVKLGFDVLYLVSYYYPHPLGYPTVKCLEIYYKRSQGEYEQEDMIVADAVGYWVVSSGVVPKIVSLYVGPSASAMLSLEFFASASAVVSFLHNVYKLDLEIKNDENFFAQIYDNIVSIPRYFSQALGGYLKDEESAHDNLTNTTSLGMDSFINFQLD